MECALRFKIIRERERKGEKTERESERETRRNIKSKPLENLIKQWL